MLRKLFHSDLHQVRLIEESIQIAPWTDEIFKNCFAAGCRGWVVEVDKKVIGFILIALGLDECHVLNLGVLHLYQQQGWGRKLLESSLLYAKQQGVMMAYLEVRCSNSRAISLYQKMNFQCVGQRKDYYVTVSGHEDAFIFAKNLFE